MDEVSEIKTGFEIVLPLTFLAKEFGVKRISISEIFQLEMILIIFHLQMKLKIIGKGEMRLPPVLPLKESLTLINPKKNGRKRSSFQRMLL